MANKINEFLERPLWQIGATLVAILLLSIVLYALTGEEAALGLVSPFGFGVWIVGAYRHVDDTLRAYGLR